MKEIRRLLIIVLVVAPLLSLYITFVIKNLWNWFAAEALNLPQVSFWVMYGIVLMIGMFTSDFGDIEQKYSFKAFGVALDACVPDDKKAWVLEELEAQQESIWRDVAIIPFMRILGATVTLVIGWGVHTFLL